jgi:hypothetical protein
MRFAHLKTHHGFERLRLRGLSGARDEISPVRIKVNASRIAAETASAAQSEDRSANQKTTFFDSIDQLAQKSGPLVSFRVPPTPFREPAYTKGPGHCCVCGQPIFRFGWHRDLWGDRRPNQNAKWHSCCVAAWNLWIAPSDHVRHLKVLQKRRCLATSERLLSVWCWRMRFPTAKTLWPYREALAKAGGERAGRLGGWLDMKSWQR